MTFECFYGNLCYMDCMASIQLYIGIFSLVFSLKFFVCSCDCLWDVYSPFLFGVTFYPQHTWLWSDDFCNILLGELSLPVVMWTCMQCSALMCSSLYVFLCSVLRWMSFHVWRAWRSPITIPQLCHWCWSESGLYLFCGINTTLSLTCWPLVLILWAILSSSLIFVESDLLKNICFTPLKCCTYML